MIDSYISVKQEKRKKQGLEVIKQQGKNYIDLYSEGWLDGLSGLEHRSPDIYFYWQGYQERSTKILVQTAWFRNTRNRNS